jgi:hypothetical protein
MRSRSRKLKRNLRTNYKISEISLNRSIKAKMVTRKEMKNKTTRIKRRRSSCLVRVDLMRTSRVIKRKSQLLRPSFNLNNKRKNKKMMMIN